MLSRAGTFGECSHNETFQDLQNIDDARWNFWSRTSRVLAIAQRPISGECVMRQVDLAIVSDLHVGDAARAKDLCPEADKFKGVGDTYRKTFVEFVKREGIKSDFLIVPGDATHRAHTKEASLASDVVKEIASALGVRKSCIVFVPGNHDVDWTVLAEKDDAVRWGQRYDPINYKAFVFNKIMHKGHGKLLEAPYLSVWEFDAVLIVGYNSSWHDNPDEMLHHGRFDDSQLTALRTILGNLDLGDHRLRIFLVHHHPVAYDVPAGAPDFSQMVNSEQLLQLLHDSYFDFVIHGHTHQPRVQTLVRDAAHPVGILSAGSFSLQLPLEWQGKIANQFHLLKIDGRDSTTRCIQGSVRSWSYYLAHGWIPSVAERDGIAHVEPFGVYLAPHELCDALRDIVAKSYATSGWSKWSDIRTAHPSFGYVRPSAVFRALRELATEMQFVVHGESLEQVVLLKEAHHG